MIVKISRFYILFILSFLLTLSLPLLPWVQVTADVIYSSDHPQDKEQRTVGVRFVTADPPRFILTEAEARMGIVPQWGTLLVQQTYWGLVNFGRFIFLVYPLLWFAILIRYKKRLIAYLSLFSFVGGIILLFCKGQQDFEH
jgi:hypothetical protein